MNEGMLEVVRPSAQGVGLGVASPQRVESDLVVTALILATRALGPRSSSKPRVYAS